MFRCKNFENRLIFGYDMDKSMWLSFFLAHPVVLHSFVFEDLNSTQNCDIVTVTLNS